MRPETDIAARTDRRARLLVAAFAGVLLWALTACQAQLTPDGKPYKIVVSGNRLYVTNTLSGNNNREALWSSTTATASDSQECARWVSGVGLSQNGLAFRIRSDSGGWDAVVLERNIWMRAFWMFKVIYFHSGSGQKSLFDVAPQDADLSGYLGKSTVSDVYPLRVCAQITGNVLRFAVAKGADPMVPLGTAGRGAVLTLAPPSTMRQPGETGTYVGHIPNFATSVVDSITINGTPAPMPNT